MLEFQFYYASVPIVYTYINYIIVIIILYHSKSIIYRWFIEIYTSETMGSYCE